MAGPPEWLRLPRWQLIIVYTFIGISSTLGALKAVGVEFPTPVWAGDLKPVLERLEKGINENRKAIDESARRSERGIADSSRRFERGLILLEINIVNDQIYRQERSLRHQDTEDGRRRLHDLKKELEELRGRLK